MAWITLTLAKVKSRMVDAEITAIEAAGEDDATPNEHVQGAIDQVTQMVRGRVGACSTNLPLGDDGTIPDELEWAAIALVRHTVAASIPNWDDVQGEDRRNEYDRALQTLRDASRCEIAIVPPAGTETAPATSDVCYTTDPLMDFSM